MPEPPCRRFDHGQRSWLARIRQVGRAAKHCLCVTWCQQRMSWAASWGTAVGWEQPVEYGSTAGSYRPTSVIRSAEAVAEKPPVETMLGHSPAG